MSWTTGTATDHIDLINKLRTFLTNQSWVQVLGNTATVDIDQPISMKGPGLAGNDSIYSGLELLANPALDTYTLRLWGHAGLNPLLQADEQPLQSFDTFVPIWNQPMTYWFIGNARRWMMAVKVSTVYTSCYVGFMLPFATPSEYPYPFFIGGNTSSSAYRWSSVDERARFLASPGFQAASMFWPDNVWRYVYNHQNNSNYYTNDRGNGYMSPTRFENSGFTSVSGDAMTNGMGKCFDGSYMLRDLIPCSQSPYNAMMGALDGAFWVPGREQSAENIITVGGVDHLVIQNMARTGFRDYMAMRLS